MVSPHAVSTARGSAVGAMQRDHATPTNTMANADPNYCTNLVQYTWGEGEVTSPSLYGHDTIAILWV